MKVFHTYLVVDCHLFMSTGWVVDHLRWQSIDIGELNPPNERNRTMFLAFLPIY